MADKPKSCIRCSHCCQNLTFFFPKSPAMAQWLEHRGFQYVQHSEKWVEASLPIPCPFLEIIDGLGNCTVQDDKPEICKRFPQLHDKNLIKSYASKGLDIYKSLGPECGYRSENAPIA